MHALIQGGAFLHFSNNLYVFVCHGARFALRIARIWTHFINHSSQYCHCKCRWEPSTGFTWHFEAKDDDEDDEEFATSAAQRRRKRRRRILDNRPPGARTEEEEEGIRASEAIDSILVRLSKSDVVVNGKTRAIKPKSDAAKDKK